MCDHELLWRATRIHWHTAAVSEGVCSSALSFIRRSTTGKPCPTASITAVDEFGPPADPASATNLPKALLWYTPRCSAIFAPNDLQSQDAQGHNNIWPVGIVLVALLEGMVEVWSSHLK